MRLSAIVLSFNSVHHIGPCIRSLVKSGGFQRGLDEIIVIDNGSSDGSTEKIEQLRLEYPDLIHAIFSRTNLGTTVSRNLALNMSRGQWILIVDSDVTLLDDTLHRLMEIGSRAENCGILAPRLIYPNGRPQKSTDYFPTLWRKIARLLYLRRMERVDNLPNKDYYDAHCVDYAISAFWLMPRATLHRVGLLDSNIFYSPEDVDYCIRVWNAGLSVSFVHESVAIHDARELSRGWKGLSFIIYHILGLAYLFTKHRYCFGRRRLYARVGRFRRPTKPQVDSLGAERSGSW